ncbi:MAG: glutathione-disulfide reductase [Proteobacteria bacterium]|nr:glutathione-disulfide reductase [Pseudomonadota bacterium]
MDDQYDVLVIGGGSGGIAHARRAAEYGARVAVVEHGPLGGTCVNVGCVPKKVTWYMASLAYHFRHAADYGFSVVVDGHDWATLKLRRDAYVSRLNKIYEGSLDSSGVDYLVGTACFVDAHTVAVGNKRYSAERLVIATGGRPIVPDVPGAEHGITSDGFFALTERPARVLIIGSGYIAVEFAGMFNALGTATQVAVRKDGLVRSFDTMLGRELRVAMQKDGIEIQTGAVPSSIEATNDGLVLQTEGGRTIGPVDCVIWAVGREPNTAGLGLDKAGVAMDSRGFVAVDKFQQTNVEHIAALGDVTGRQALTPVAIAAGRRLADRLYGGMMERHLDYETIPTVIFSHPPMGTVGMTEDEARDEHGDAVKIYTTKFAAMYYALGENKPQTAMKLITVGDDERVVGCHVIGDGAEEMMQGFAVAIRMGATKSDFDDTVAIHPTSAEELVTMR